MTTTTKGTKTMTKGQNLKTVSDILEARRTQAKAKSLLQEALAGILVSGSLVAGSWAWLRAFIEAY